MKKTDGALFLDVPDLLQLENGFWQVLQMAPLQHSGIAS